MEESIHEPKKWRKKCVNDDDKNLPQEYANNEISTSNLTGYPGDLKFPGRCGRFYTNLSSSWRPIFGIWSVNWLTWLFMTRMEVPRSTVTCTRELERRQTARQVEPGGMEELWWEGFNFINSKILITNISAFSGREGRLARSRGLCVYSREC